MTEVMMPLTHLCLHTQEIAVHILSSLAKNINYTVLVLLDDFHVFHADPWVYICD